MSGKLLVVILVQNAIMLIIRCLMSFAHVLTLLGVIRFLPDQIIQLHLLIVLVLLQAHPVVRLVFQVLHLALPAL